MLGIVLACCFATVLADEEVGVADFVKMMKSLHSEAFSIGAIYEGDLQFLDDRGNEIKQKETRRFQGTYSMRFTGKHPAALLDWYSMHSTGEPAIHNSISFFNGVFERSDPAFSRRYGDPRSKKQVVKELGHPAFLPLMESPHFFLWQWYFVILDEYELSWICYDFMGWESIAGHRCLKVRLRKTPVPDSVADTIMWIDLNRGGHPLRVDTIFNGWVNSTVDDVVLSRVETADEKTVWMPVSGVRRAFIKPGESNQGMTENREHNGLVLGSIQINEDLPDSVFVVHTKAKKLTENAAKLAAKVTSVKEFTPPPRPKTDPASVQKRLQAELEEASRQARELEASSPAREAWSWTQAMQLGLVVLGVSAIGAAVYWRRRLS